MKSRAFGPRSSGFTMVEVLVALVVLAVGMLGIAGLYVMTLQSGGSAIYRMQAVSLASELADRIRANRNAGAVYAGAAVATACAGAFATTIVCTPTQMAQNDLFLFNQRVTSPTVLPNGTWSVTVNGASPATYIIRVNWTETGNQAMSYTLTTQI